jgi:hypothetical protein
MAQLGIEHRGRGSGRLGQSGRQSLVLNDRGKSCVSGIVHGLKLIRFAYAGTWQG